MKIIVGLGNPGKKYQNNRHNVGFQFIDYLIENLQTSNLKFQKNKYLASKIARLMYDRTEVVLAKPTIFMNKSGEAVKKIVSCFMFHVSQDLIIVHDDLDIPLGKFKIQKGVGPKLHHGLESIEKALGTKDFWRVRIGVDNRPISPERSAGWRRVEGETYVLQDFLPEEKEIINQIFPKIHHRLKSEFFPWL